MSLPSCTSLPLDKKVLDDLTERAKDWALCHGLCMRSKDVKDAAIFAPFLLLPSTFPRTEFEKVVQVQAALQKLMHLVSENYTFLRESLASTIRVDEFTAKLFEIYETVKREGFAQPISLGLIRSDYILDVPTFAAKQVEVNMIASSFGALTSILPDWHRYALNYLGQAENASKVCSSGTLQGYAKGMLAAWTLHGNPKAAILFVVEVPTINICDQRFLEYEIGKQNPNVCVLRLSLTQIGEKAVLDPLTKNMTIDGKTIGVIYFRDGYGPDAYRSKTEWDARLLMERSTAIKCPSIQYQLAGTKKIQQELARPGVLEKFLLDSNEVAAVRQVFTGLYSLDMNENDVEKVIDEAIANPGKYVLKPQREGGGNNMYNDDIKRYFEANRNSGERTGWILMDKITAPLQRNYILRAGSDDPIFTDVVSELGIFGVLIGKMGDIYLNEQAGHMLRTKPNSVNEAGVASGFGALDSVFITDL